MVVVSAATFTPQALHVGRGRVAVLLLLLQCQFLHLTVLILKAVVTVGYSRFTDNFYFWAVKIHYTGIVFGAAVAGVVSAHAADAEVELALFAGCAVGAIDSSR